MPIKKKLQWVEISALPGQRGNQKIKGLIGAITGEKPFKMVYAFTKDGEFFRGEFLRNGIKVTPINTPAWAKYIIEIETPGIYMDGLFDTRRKIIYKILDDPYTLRSTIRSAETYLRFLKKLQQL